jgi:hypothetical protein
MGGLSYTELEDSEAGRGNHARRRAARKENFSDATGHSGVVTSVSKDGVVTVMAAHATKIGVDMSFQPSSKEYINHYQRYTGD